MFTVTLNLISYTAAPIYLALDDTLIAKVGKHFEKVKLLFNHANQSCKSCVKKELINCALYNKNLEIICNVRSDTVMYELTPEMTGKRGRPRKHGDKIVNFKGTRKVLTNIFGERVVTENLCNKSLFLSTIDDFSGYSKRWIEVNYYEHKIFWSLGEYRVRSKQGIENLVNLINVAHASMKILPYAEPSLEKYEKLSAQQVRFQISEIVRSNLFLDSLALRAKSMIKSNRFMKELNELTQSMRISA